MNKNEKRRGIVTEIPPRNVPPLCVCVCVCVAGLGVRGGGGVGGRGVCVWQGWGCVGGGGG